MLYSELQKDMQFRRNTEFRYFSFATGLSTAAVPVGVSLTKVASTIPALQAGCLGMAAIVVILNAVASKRILYENKIYRTLGSSSVSILKQLLLLTTGTDSVLPPATEKYGQGTAYRWTLALMWGVCVLVIIALSGVAFFGKVV